MKSYPQDFWRWTLRSVVSPSLSYPSFDSLFSRQVNCWFSSPTRRRIISSCAQCTQRVRVCACLYPSLCGGVLLKHSSGLHCVCVRPVSMSKCVPCILFFFRALERTHGGWVCVRGGWQWGVLEQVVHLRVRRCTSAVIWEWDSQSATPAWFQFSSKTLLTSLQKLQKKACTGG